MTSVFAKMQQELFPYRFSGQLTVGTICGGVPTDENVAEGWIKAKLGATDDRLRAMVAETMIDRGVTAEEATEEVVRNKHLNGFKREPAHGPYIEGRQLKAAIKEAASCALAAGNLGARWGKTSKGLLSFVAEHIFVTEDRLPLGVPDVTGINQRFVHTWRGSSIQYEEYVDNAVIDFTVISDHNFTPKEWAAIWTSGEQQGIGASRSQGYGRYEVTRWACQTC